MSKKSEQDRVAPFGQNPHAIRESRENNLELAIGHEVRTLRKKLGLTVTDLANATGISSGMLSKIENGNISPSLSSLQALSGALGIPLTALFRGFEERRSASYVKSGEGLDIERRGTRARVSVRPILVDQPHGRVNPDRRPHRPRRLRQVQRHAPTCANPQHVSA